MSETDKVKVAVRLRPMNKRELELQTTCIVEMKDNQTFLHSPHSNLDGGSKQPKVFAFDHCFWSMDPEDSRFASQADVFEALGTCVLDSAFQGYNGCIFAYGQTGSGKSYTMMGSQDTQKGIIPRLCDAMFNRIQSQGATDDSVSCKVEVSYIEIYNEKVHDLLDLSGPKKYLKVREHNILGPYVDGLSQLVVSSFEDIDSLMNEGNKSRTVAATNMNNESSRSHAVFNITLTQTVSDCQLDVQGEKVSKLSLVDLAGSERAVKTGAVGDRLREGSNINKSLTTLGLVISALADNSKTKKFVPYRDSVLTWLLKDNLGGNSRTLMVATLSPAGDNYEETLSTLRYADRAKRIVNHAVVNEDPNARIIRELREEVETLKAQLESAQAVAAPQLTEKLQESEKLMKEMSKTWEEKLLETERRHKERHEALEKMGVSVQASGIRVDSSSCYLVNLNADPSLNELLVYYLKERTCIGCAENQDIQLNGLGIKPQHCVITVSNEDDVLIAPQPHARTLLNGCEITSPTKAKHGDRILWGNHHYFRVNHPKMAASASHETSNFDYADAQAEVALNGTSSESLRLAMEALERRYESDKEEALARQKQMYEGLLKNFSNILSPATPSYCPPMMLMSHDGASSSFSLNSSGAGGCEQGSSDGPEGQQLKAQQLNLSRLKEQLARANALVREANFLSAELGAGVEYSVTLQIPAHNLIRRHIATEPAIQLTAAGSDEDADSPGAVLATWSLDKFENRLVDMRESYHEFTAGSTDSVSAFRDHHEQHDLIGVAHAFLSPLFYDAPLDYNVPVINTQGEIAGKLHVRLAKFSGRFEPGQQVTLKVCIRSAKALPKELSHFVYVQYQLWGMSAPQVVPPVTADCGDPPPDLIAFDHEAQFDIFVNDEFLEFAADGSLAVQVYGNRSNGAEVRGERIGDNWSEYCRRLEMWLCIQELSENGQYLPVEIQHPTQRDRQGREKDVIPTGGVYRLKHGQSRRLLIRVRPVSGPESGSLPVICERITDVSVGCIVRRDRSMQRGLDSYQEEDLTRLRDKWREAVSRRQGHLQSQLSLITSKPVKTAADEARERSLMEQWSRMTVEKEAVLVPRPHSCVPGAPADWDPPLGMEEHIPVLFLDLQPDHHQRLELPPAGVNSQLPKEHNSEFVQVPIMRSLDKDCCVICQWDASLHDSIYLNRITGNNELIYLIVRARVRISHPAPMDIVLRKRACVSVYKSKGIRSALFGYMRAYVSPASADPIRDLISETGITYQIVSSIPPATGEVEDRKSLAVLAAASSDAISSLAGPAEDSSSCSLLAESSAISDSKLTDGNSAAPAAPGSAASSNGSWRPAQPDSETYIKQYLSAVSAVDYFLREEKARQEAAVKFSKNAKTRATRKSMQVMGADGGQMIRSVSLGSLSLLKLNEPGYLAGGQAASVAAAAGGPPVPPQQQQPQQQPSASVQNLHAALRRAEPPSALIGPVGTAAKNPLISPLSSHPAGVLGGAGGSGGAGGLMSRSSLLLTPMKPLAEEAASFGGHRGGPGGDFLGEADFPDRGGDAASEDSDGGDGGSRRRNPFNEDCGGRMRKSKSERAQLTQSMYLDRDTSWAAFQQQEVPQPVDSAILETAQPPPAEPPEAPSLTQPPPPSVGTAAEQAPEVAEAGEGEDLVRLTRLLQSPKRAAQKAPNGGGGDEDFSDSASAFGSRQDLSGSGRVDTAPPAWLKPGEPCLVQQPQGAKLPGHVRFCGPTQFAAGTWVGVELDQPEGRNDGSVKGVKYFRCRARHGLFVRHDKVLQPRRRASQQMKSGK
ncbi:hypothetical protein BOX15_Mlig023364g1 [Macrostomum lignano]|uniref:Kinesin motor domain-containing protein n=1 Tax=Macrostomum lignano TaxID=282301 RepID=A0A267GNU2_9PLAT|nr:hypothetical protein BOX15_Mlig023364g1 [Macrostomum lignano]